MKNILSVFAVILVLVAALSFLSSSFPGRSTGTSDISTEESSDSISLEGMKISFLGDSITTYDGYSNSSRYNSTLINNTKYYPSTHSNNDLTSVKDTYWYQVIDELSLELCVNNACDASRVSDTRSDNIPNGMERASELHRTTSMPDIIVVYIGTNDIANGVSLATFAESYNTMISTICESYPEAAIYVCTLLPERRYSDDVLLCSFNEAIKDVATEYSCTVVDFYANSGITWDNYTNYTIDNLHPNASGMDKLTKCVVEAIRSKI